MRKPYQRFHENRDAGIENQKGAYIRQLRLRCDLEKALIDLAAHPSVTCSGMGAVISEDDSYTEARNSFAERYGEDAVAGIDATRKAALVRIGLLIRGR